MPFPTASPTNIRLLLDLTLDSTAMPDSVIQSAVFLTRAENAVKAADADAESYLDGSAEQAKVKLAVELLTASYLCGAWQRKIEESFVRGDYSYRRPEWDAEARAAELRAEAEALLDDLLGAVGPMPHVFTAADGGRGG